MDQWVEIDKLKTLIESQNDRINLIKEKIEYDPNLLQKEENALQALQRRLEQIELEKRWGH